MLSERSGVLGIAYGTRAYHVSVKECSEKYANGKDMTLINCQKVSVKSSLDYMAEETIKDINAKKNKPSSESFFEGLFQGIKDGASELAARAGFPIIVNQVARKILLGEEMMTEQGVLGWGANIADAQGTMDPGIRTIMRTPCPFRLLYPEFCHDTETFIALSKLYANYLLMDRGVVDVIKEFTATLSKTKNIQVSLKGSRAGLTQDVSPIEVTVQGTYALEASP
jgi:hypothetical protein